MAKFQVGTDAGSYTFNAAGKTVTIAGIGTTTLTLDEVMAIIHAPSGTLLYQIGNTALAAASYTPAAGGGVITLNAGVSTGGMANGDPLFVLVDAPAATAPTPTTSADITANGTITGSGTTQITTSGKGSVAFAVSGVWTGAIVIDLQDANGAWWPTSYTALASGNSASTFSANTSGQINCIGYQACRLRGSTISSGTAIVYFTASDKVSNVMLDNPIPTGSNTIGNINTVNNVASVSGNVATNHELWRDSFLSIDLTNNWQIYVGSNGATPTLVPSPTSITSPFAGTVYQFTNGDILFSDGNVLSGSYANLVKHPFNQNTDTWMLSRNTFTGPVRMISGLSISQRVAYNELSYENVGVDGTGAVVSDTAYTPVALVSINVTTANQLNIVTTATPHLLKSGDRFMITNAQGPTSAVAMNIGPAVVTTVLGPTTFASVTSWVALTLATGVYVGINSTGTVTKLEPLAGAQFGYSTLFDGVSAGNTWAVSRDGASGSASQFGSWNPGNTQDTAVVPSPVFSFSQPYTYSYQPRGTFEMYGLRDYLAWATVDTDVMTAARSSIDRSQNVPTPARNYKSRFRAKNFAAPVFIGRVILTSKAGSTTATVTTDVPHTLRVNDPVVIGGQRDQANFASQTTAVFVASIVNPYQFTVVYGILATATSYGGYVARADTAAVNATIQAISGGALQSMRITADGRLGFVNNAAVTNMVVGDTHWVSGVMDNSSAGTQGTVNYGALEGFYRVALVSSTIVELEPLQGQITAASATGIYATAGFSGGTLYTQGVYTNVPLTGGTGTGAVATITVLSTGVVGLVNLTSLGQGFTNGDILTAAAANIGGTGSGFSFSVSSAGVGPVQAVAGVQQGSGYTNGTYSTIATTGGSGTGLTVTVTVTGGLVAGAAGAFGVAIVGAGATYRAGDVITIPLANIGGTGTVAPTFIVYSVQVNGNASGLIVKATSFRMHYIRCLDMTMDVVEAHSGSARGDANHAMPVMVGNASLTVSATNLSTNIAQIAGTAPPTAGVAGTLVTGGAVANGVAPTTNPNLIAGIDGSGLTRRVLTDTLGNVAVGGSTAVGVRPTANPVGVGAVDQAGLTTRLGAVSQSALGVPALATVSGDSVEGMSQMDLLFQILMEMRIMNQTMVESINTCNPGIVDIDEPSVMRNDPTFMKN